jgi:hypothetical protein
VYFGSQFFFLMALGKGYVVDTAEVPTSGFAVRPLSGLKCEVVFHHASRLTLAVLVSLIFNGFVHFFQSFVIVAVDSCF